VSDNPNNYLNEPGLRLYDTLIKGYVDGKVPVLYNTTTGWNSQPSLVSAQGFLYVYTDYKKNAQNQDIAGIKFGDGQAYLIDLPFIDEMLYEHLNDNIKHITQQEREFWNNKVRCYADPNNPDSLIFTTN